MVVGLAYAVTAVIYNEQTCNRTTDAHGPLNEEHMPLNTEPAKFEALPRDGYKMLKSMISCVVFALEMSAVELVVASVIFEGAVRHSPKFLSRATARPLLLGSLCLASQVCSDEELTVGMAFDAVAPFFESMKFVHFKSIVVQTLVLIDWCIPIESSVYNAYAEALTKSANDTTGRMRSVPTLFD